jgi:hypothetical protein
MISSFVSDRKDNPPHRGLSVTKFPGVGGLSREGDERIGTKKGTGHKVRRLKGSYRPIYGKRLRCADSESGYKNTFISLRERRRRYPSEGQTEWFAGPVMLRGSKYDAVRHNTAEKVWVDAQVA